MRSRRRWVITTTLNNNLLRAKIPPLLNALTDLELIVVTDRVGPRIERVRYVVPSGTAVKLFGRLIPRWCRLLREVSRRGVERVMVYNALPHLLLAFLPVKLFGRRLDLHMIAGKLDLDFAATPELTDNRLVRGLRNPVGLQNLLRWMALRHGDRLFVPGVRTRDWLLGQNVAADRIVSIHSAIDPQRYSPGNGERDIDVLIVANLHIRKRPELTIRILECILRDRPASRFVWIGDGNMRDEVRRMVAGSTIRDACELPGHVEDVVSCNRRARIILLNSAWEGLSCATMEAMACGVVPVSADVGDMAEIVRPGETGALVDPDADAQEYAQAILALLNDSDQLESYSRASRELIIREHSFEAITRAWRELES